VDVSAELEGTKVLLRRATESERGLEVRAYNSHDRVLCFVDDFFSPGTIGCQLMAARSGCHRRPPG
jgi:hypothetical protein